MYYNEKRGGSAMRSEFTSAASGSVHASALQLFSDFYS